MKPYLKQTIIGLTIVTLTYSGVKLPQAAPLTFSGGVSEQPEPGTIVPLGTGLLGLAVYGWRRKQQTV